MSAQSLAAESTASNTPSRVDRVRIVEVGPRDGLQNEGTLVPTADKVRFIDALSHSGLTDIEVTSFVNPERVPQLGDADQVATEIERRPGVRYIGLAANERGLDRALAARIDGIALFTAASDAFAERNIGRSVQESLTQFRHLADRARAAGLWVRAYVSTAFDCPFAGPTDPASVRQVVEQLMEMGVDEISIGDTIGSAVPSQVARLTEALLPVLPLDRFAYHFHDTRGAAVQNVGEALRFGIAIFDASTGGLGGCPFAPGAPGNLATEQLVDYLAARGIQTGVDVKAIRAAAEMVQGMLREPPRG